VTREYKDYSSAGGIGPTHREFLKHGPAPFCLDNHDGYACTRTRGHRDDHGGHVADDVLYARWPNEEDPT
jgi:hypothetical protein